jgi:signal transduction histidine kinase
MKINVKLAAISMLAVFITALAASFLLTDFMNKERLDEKKSHAMQLRHAIISAVEVQNELYSDLLSQNVKNPDHLIDYVAVGVLTEDRNQASGWKSEWIKSPNLNMTSEWISGLLKDLPLARVHEGDAIWSKVKTVDQQVYFVILNAQQAVEAGQSSNKVAFGILPTSAFSQINSITKGENESAFVVDVQGTSYSYPEQQFVGTKLDTHPVVATLLKSGVNEFDDVFKSTKAESILGGFELIGKSNLYAVVTSPMPTRGATVFKFMIQLAVVCIAIMIFTALAINLISANDLKKMKILEQNMSMILEQEEVSSPSIKINRDGTKEFAKALASYFREPLSFIVGQLQIVEKKVSATKSTADRSVLEPLNKIQVEARKLRDFIYSMINYAQLNESKLKGADGSASSSEVIDLNIIANQVLGVFKKELIQKIITLEELFLTEAKVRGSYDEIKDSLKTILSFVIHTVAAGSGEKKIKFSIENSAKNTGQALVKIEAFGSELKSEVKKNLFVPFAVALPDSYILGMDLALAQHQLVNMNCDIVVESLSYDSFRVLIYFPALNMMGIEANSSLILSSKNETAPKFPPAPSTETSSEIKISDDLVLEAESSLKGSTKDNNRNKI